MGFIIGIRACFVFDPDHFVVSKTLYFSSYLLSVFFMNQRLSRTLDERLFFGINDHRDLSNDFFLFSPFFFLGLLIKFNVLSLYGLKSIILPLFFISQKKRISYFFVISIKKRTKKNIFILITNQK